MLEEGEGLGLGSVDRWSVHKWCLLLSVSTLLVYGLAGLICAVLTWFRTYDKASVIIVADKDILLMVTLASSVLLLCFLVGISGTILNSRPLLAVYAVLLWPAFLAIIISQWYTPVGRLILQDTLRCCGYYDSLHEATVSRQCYPRTPLPGCKAKLYRYERDNLTTVWAMAFAFVPLHILNIIVSLLCSNHITQTFGKGIMPKRYDLQADPDLASRGYP
ncbi:hypothetical protein C8Q72DRAFT_876087 [Fomitopsis betulina]|nr:hypothetical protein C8Q72DRAFT_876087 [Fomitopsis betulina]